MTDPQPDPIAAAAAQAAQAAPPEPAPEPEVHEEELPDEADVFDRDYVEKLRAEAAKHRTARRPFEDAFQGFSDGERDRFLDLARKLYSDPESALEEFEGVVSRLSAQLGRTPVTQPAPAPAPEPEPSTETFTAEDVQRIVQETIAAERAKETETAEVRQVFEQAKALDPIYTEGSPQLVQLLAVAQTEGSLEKAHEILTGQLDAYRQQVIEEYRASLTAGGRRHAPRLDASEPRAPGGSPDEVTPGDLKTASARARERFQASAG